MSENEYLDQVQAQARQVRAELKMNRSVAPGEIGRRARRDDAARSSPPSPALAGPVRGPADPGGRDDEATSESNGLGVRVTGIWPFKTVVVPPNMYVIHTRRGAAEPRTIGLGRSFRFDPYSDSFLVVPSAMQTIQIAANSICRELQGLLIQAYVQWIIDDITVAYRRLDFSDIDDPMRVVNVQLREQAEAAIKDKVATMSIHEVLSDKQPIIEELTRRLKTVAEGSSDDDSGLGIRIVTVQIKEAVVSSSQLWQTLQGPFRAAQRSLARLAEIEAEEEIQRRARAERQASAQAELEVEARLGALRAEQEAIEFDRQQREASRREQLEEQAARERAAAHGETEQHAHAIADELRRRQQALAHATQLEQAQKATELERRRLELSVELYREQVAELDARLEKELAAKRAQAALETEEQAATDQIAAARHEAKLARDAKDRAAENSQRQIELGFDSARREIANRLSDAHVRLEAVRSIPTIAAALPKPERLESISLGAGDTVGLAGTLAQVMAVLRSFGVLNGATLADESAPAHSPGADGSSTPT